MLYAGDDLVGWILLLLGLGLNLKVPLKCHPSSMRSKWIVPNLCFAPGRTRIPAHPDPDGHAREQRAARVQAGLRRAANRHDRLDGRPGGHRHSDARSRQLHHEGVLSGRLRSSDSQCAQGSCPSNLLPAFRRVKIVRISTVSLSLCLSLQMRLHSPRTNYDTAMVQFEQLINNKQFLLTFIETLEAQKSFNIRDKWVVVGPRKMRQNTIQSKKCVGQTES